MKVMSMIKYFYRPVFFHLLCILKNQTWHSFHPTLTHIYIYICVCVCVCVCINTYSLKFICVCTPTHIYTLIYIYRVTPPKNRSHIFLTEIHKFNSSLFFFFRIWSRFSEWKIGTIVFTSMSRSSSVQN